MGTDVETKRLTDRVLTRDDTPTSLVTERISVENTSLNFSTDEIRDGPPTYTVEVEEEKR